MTKKVKNLPKNYVAWVGVGLLLAVTKMACTGSEVQTTPMTTVAVNPCATQPASNPCNPCAARTPPPHLRASKNPCNSYSTSGRVDPRPLTRPIDSKPYQGDMAALLIEGERLWNDRDLGTSGLACGICHLNNGNFNPSFAQPYPHSVAMTQQMAGLSQVSLEEMVQFCMVQAMAAQPLPWNSRELAALTTYTQQIQKGFIQAVAANPDLLKRRAANPCNPCGVQKK